MKSIKIATLVFAFAILLFFAFVVIQGYRHLSCESPIVYNIFSQGSEERVNEVILALGGLPKSDIDDLGSVMNRWGGVLAIEPGVALPPIYPVNEWQIEPSSVTATQFSYYGLFDDSSKYSYRFNVHVTYADGDTAVLQWSSWGYGTVACPILISLGSGPPGQLQIMP